MVNTCNKKAQVLMKHKMHYSQQLILAMCLGKTAREEFVQSQIQILEDNVDVSIALLLTLNWTGAIRMLYY